MFWRQSKLFLVATLLVAILSCSREGNDTNTNEQTLANVETQYEQISTDESTEEADENACLTPTNTQKSKYEEYEIQIMTFECLRDEHEGVQTFNELRVIDGNDDVVFTIDGSFDARMSGTTVINEINLPYLVLHSVVGYSRRVIHKIFLFETQPEFKQIALIEDPTRKMVDERVRDYEIEGFYEVDGMTVIDVFRLVDPGDCSACGTYAVDTVSVQNGELVVIKTIEN